VNQTREELEQQALDLRQQLGRALKASTDSYWMQLDLTVAQLRTLFILAEEGPLIIGQIAQRLNIGLSTGGHLVDRLVQAGFAERAEDSGDRRRTVARLTPQGEDLYSRLLIRGHLLQILIEQLHEDELAALVLGLQGLNRVAEEQKIAQAGQFEDSVSHSTV
jgi:MarR family transcriptional regulator, organic hydroperoxide resistance regulator